MGIEGGGLFGLIILVLDIWAILKIVDSAASAAGKALWIVIIVMLPLLGLIIWWLAGPRGGARPA